MDRRGRAVTRSSKVASLLTLLMAVSLLPLIATPVSAAPSINLNVSPNSMEVNPGDSGEYTVVVTNTGSDPVTVNLQVSNEPGENCNGFSSTIVQIPGQIDSGSSEETTMNVSVAQTVEPDTSCDTTVTATITAVIGAPAAEIPEPSTETVTTTAGDGSGSTVFGVDLYFGNPDVNQQSKTLSGSSNEETYIITVENTGQTNSTINLVLEEVSGGGCDNPSSITATLSDSAVTLDTEETEIITVDIEVPEGQQAADYCWEVTGTVSASNPAQNATDTVELQLEVPELRECSMSLSKTTISVNPGSEGTFSATLTNDGNSDWNVNMGRTGERASWVSFDGPSSGLLPYSGGSGTKTFDFKVNPDDSENAGSSNAVTIQAKDGNTLKCSKVISIVVGQSFGATISLSSPTLGPIDPGENKTSSLTVTNTGNGQDNFRITVSSPQQPGWSVSLEKTTVSLNSKHTSGKSESVGFSVSVPEDALATNSIELTFTVLPAGGGAAYQSKILTVTVSETHGMEVETSVFTQTGRSYTELLFPIEVDNLGNNDDVFRFYTKSQRPSNGDDWDIWFTNDAGETKSEFSIPAMQQATINMYVRVPDVANWEFTEIEVEITNLEDNNNADGNGDGLPDNKRALEFRAVKSNVEYSMDLRLGDGEYNSVTIDNRAAVVILAPDGSMTFSFWVENTGDEDDFALIEISGLEGVASRQIYVDGEIYDGRVQIQKGYAIWNLTDNSFATDSNGNPFISASEYGAEDIMESEGLMEHEVRPFKKKFTAYIDVSPSALTGQGGTLELIATSENNAADKSGKATLSLDVQTIYDIQFSPTVELYHELTYPDRKEIPVEIFNDGNVKTEFYILTPESFRGWSVEVDRGNATCSDTSEGLKCWLEVGESVIVDVIVRPSFDAEIKDNYTFTLSVEPVETGVVDRENIEISVLGVPDEGLLGLGLSQSQLESGVYAIIGIMFLAILYRAIKPKK